MCACVVLNGAARALQRVRGLTRAENGAAFIIARLQQRLYNHSRAREWRRQQRLQVTQRMYRSLRRDRRQAN